MTTEQIANRLVELCRNWKNKEAYEELFADHAVAIEPEGAPMRETKGKEALLAKNDQFGEMMEEFHENSVTDPIVMGNHFTVGMMLDVTMKGRGRDRMEELCVYEVKDGKIVKEEFFYEMPQQK